MDQATIIVVDDDSAARDSLDVLVTSADHRCESFDSAEAFLEQPLPAPPCCAIVDMQMPGMDGFELQAALNAQSANLPLVFVSAERTAERVTHAIRAGAVDFLAKPFDPEYLLARVSCGVNASVGSNHAMRPYWLDAVAPAELTARQQSILQLMAYQTTVPEIAAVLAIQIDAVETEYESAMTKLRLHAVAGEVYTWINRSWEENRGGLILCQ